MHGPCGLSPSGGRADPSQTQFSSGSSLGAREHGTECVEHEGAEHEGEERTAEVGVEGSSEQGGQGEERHRAELSLDGTAAERGGGELRAARFQRRRRAQNSSAERVRGRGEERRRAELSPDGSRGEEESSEQLGPEEEKRGAQGAGLSPDGGRGELRSAQRKGGRAAERKS